MYFYYTGFCCGNLTIFALRRKYLQISHQVRAYIQGIKLFARLNLLMHPVLQSLQN